MTNLFDNPSNNRMQRTRLCRVRCMRIVSRKGRTNRNMDGLQAANHRIARQ